MEKRRKFINGLLVEVGDMQDIPVKKNTKEDYETYKKRKRKEELEKEIWKNAKIDKEWQKEIFEDNLEEMR